MTRVVLCCATRRGLLFLERLAELLRQHSPGAELVVFSFREEPHEPRFLAAIEAEAKRVGAVFHQVRNLGSASAESLLVEPGFDLLLAVSWRYLVPPRVYQKAHRGAFVFHDSLLPTYRGFSPTVWSILNGEDHTGVTLLTMAEQVDSGDIVEQRRVPIGEEEAIGVVLERVTAVYLELLERNLPLLLNGTARTTKQDASLATYCCRLLPQDCAIDWRKGTGAIHNLIRGYSRPYPGAFARFEGRRITVWKAQPAESGARWSGRVPGRVVEVRPRLGSVVLTGDGALLLERVQLDGDGEACAADVLSRLTYTLEGFE